MPAPTIGHVWAATVTTHQLQSVKDFAARGPFSESQLRWYIHQAESNGLADAGALVRVGRRIYLSPQGFDLWITRQNSDRQKFDSVKPALEATNVG